VVKAGALVIHIIILSMSIHIALLVVLFALVVVPSTHTSAHAASHGHSPHQDECTRTYPGVSLFPDDAMSCHLSIHEGMRLQEILARKVGAIHGL